MQRSVIELGHGCLVVSLPHKWTARNHVVKGAQLDIVDDGATLTVTSGKVTATPRTTQLDVRSLGPLTRRAFDAIYKKGYDEVVVTYGQREELAPVLAAIADEAKTFEIVSQARNVCTVRSISELDQEEFDGLLRRTILLLVEMAQDVAQKLTDGDAAGLRDAIQLEGANNRFTHILRRALNREGHPDARNAMLLYTVIEQFEKAADEYKYLCIYAVARKKNATKETVAFAHAVAEFASEFAQLFYGFTIERAAAFSTRKHHVVPQGMALLETGKDAVIIHHLLSFAQVIYDQVGPLIAMRH